MTSTIKVIPTRYRGHHFRSRLEARWAVFFDWCDVPWLYEPEGFTLPNGQRYLPDFWLPGTDWNAQALVYGEPKLSGTWVEVKGTHGRGLSGISDRDYDLCKMFAIDRHEAGQRFALVGNIELDHVTPFDDMMWAWQWSPSSQKMFKDDWGPPDRGTLRAAVNAARSARFEHGESGAT